MIIVQGGINHSDEHMQIIRKAAKRGYAVLMDGRTAVDAVEDAVRVMEDSKYFNTDYGLSLLENGEVECDAMIMDGNTLDHGALISGRYFRHPVSFAKLIMKESRHCALSGEGAFKFAKENGYPFQYDEWTDSSEFLKTPNLKRPEYVRKSYKGWTDRKHSETVSAVARDTNGHFACALSTGGIQGKRKGQVGNEAIFGSGGYANKHGAATASGESIAKMTLARQVVHIMENGQSAQVSTQKALKQMKDQVDDVACVIAIDQHGNFGRACTSTEMMCWATIEDNKMESGLCSFQSDNQFVSTESLDDVGFKKQERENYNMSVVKARSLALRFTAANPCCVRVIPCEVAQQKSPLTMYIYVNTDGKGVPEDFRESSVKFFYDFEIEFVDLQQRPLCKIVTQLPAKEKRCDKKLRELGKVIEENLNVFQNRLNVTAVQASYKVEGSIVKNIPCVTVYVLGKGKIPAGETDILEMTKLNGYPFDIVEGYFQLCGDPKSRTFPLRGGVGIGVEGDEASVGTLGAFLEDEDGKRYILSCQHVLSPNRVNSDNRRKVIVQPATVDYRNKVSEIRAQMNECEERLQKQKNKLHIVADDERDRYERRVEKSRERLGILRNNMEEALESESREIGIYCSGLKQNVTVSFRSKPNAKFYVDAAIAELDDEEAQELIDHKDEQPENIQCPLFGFEKNIHTGFNPTGEIVDVENFGDEDLNELRFVKSGRTTGYTDNGQLETLNFFANRLTFDSFQQWPCSANLSDVPFKFYCSTCTPVPNLNIVDLSCLRERQFCFNCRNEIENEVHTFWAYNCLAIRSRRKPFSEKGDSGALVFDNQGRAWGMIFGFFAAEGINVDLGLASPLSVTLKALENKLEKGEGGKKLKLW
ncbi:uncharacterized protein LOC114537883 [Dendronephthya gigantea]|uniref:uncharacterized protein LOC114537883 n=1 Tax=Dendronephthya gigantea TaxID=151771 RepID=UPI00106BBFE0|nr:uncharacterized protein LOC114537883 [Dendronephthya gigantea]